MSHLSIVFRRIFEKIFSFDENFWKGRKDEEKREKTGRIRGTSREKGKGRRGAEIIKKGKEKKGRRKANKRESMKRGKGKTEAGREEKTGGRRKDARKKIIQRRRRRTDERKRRSEKEERGGKRYKGWEREYGSGERRENKFPYSYLSWRKLTKGGKTDTIIENSQTARK